MRTWLTVLALAAVVTVATAQETPPAPAEAAPAPAAAPVPAPAPAPAPAPVPAAAPAPRPSRPRPKTYAELREALARLTAAADPEGLWATCRELKASSFPEEPSAPVWVELCKGRGQQGLGQRGGARASYLEVVRQASTAAGLKNPENAAAASEARYRLGELAEADYADYPLCLRQLGLFWGSRQEAEEKIARMAAAQRAYQEAIPGAQRPWPQRAAFRVTGLHVQFYKDAATRTAPNFRGLQGPPPLPGARVDVADEALRLLMDPHRASWPTTLREVVEAARIRAERDADDPDLLAAARALVDEARSVPPTPRAPIASPFGPRAGQDRGLRTLSADGEAVLFTQRDGQVRREPLLKAGRLLMEMVQGGLNERFAPEAAVALGQGGYRAALPALRAAVEGPDDELALAAVFALGELGAQPEVALLLNAYQRAQEAGDTPPPFETPSAALFGQRERVLEALAKIGRREPLLLQELMRSPLPPREAAYVLWQVSRKELKWVYQSAVHHPDDVAAAYAVLAMVSTAPGEAKQILTDFRSRRAAACWAGHLEGLVGPRLKAAQKAASQFNTMP